MPKKNTVAAVREILEQKLPDMGMELWNVEYAKQGRDYELTVYIDKEDGVGTDDCETVSRFLGSWLDETDQIAESYYLIVSSPGMDRQLIEDRHFKRYQGSLVDVSLYKGVDGTKKYSGVLIHKTEKELVIEVDGREVALPNEIVSKVKLTVII